MYAYIYKYLIKLPTKLGKYTKLKCKMMENALPQKDFPVLNLLIFRFTVLECFFAVSGWPRNPFSRCLAGPDQKLSKDPGSGEAPIGGE